MRSMQQKVTDHLIELIEARGFEPVRAGGGWANQETLLVQSGFETHLTIALDFQRDYLTGAVSGTGLAGFHPGQQNRRVAGGLLWSRDVHKPGAITLHMTRWNVSGSVERLFTALDEMLAVLPKPELIAARSKDGAS